MDRMCAHCKLRTLLEFGSKQSHSPGYGMLGKGCNSKPYTPGFVIKLIRSRSAGFAIPRKMGSGFVIRVWLSGSCLTNVTVLQ